MKTTVFYCWPLSSSTGFVGGLSILLKGTPDSQCWEKSELCFFSLPLPRVFQADWGFKVVQPRRHKPVCVCVCLFPGYRRSLDNSSLGDWQVWWPMPVIHRLLCQVLRLLACKLCASALLFLEKRRLLSSQKINLQPEILCSHVVSSLYKGSSDDSTPLIIFSYAHWTSCTVRCNPILSDRITIKRPNLYEIGCLSLVNNLSNTDTSQFPQLVRYWVKLTYNLKASIVDELGMRLKNQLDPTQLKLHTSKTKWEHTNRNKKK